MSSIAVATGAQPGRREGSSRRRGALLVAALLVSCARPAAAQSQSAHFRLQASTLDAAGSPSNSASWRTIAAAGQELAVDASSSPHFILQSGF